MLETVANDKVCNIVHLIYRAKAYEGIAKDFEFSRRTMEEHWASGYRNAQDTLANPEVLELPDRRKGYGPSTWEGISRSSASPRRDIALLSQIGQPP